MGEESKLVFLAAAYAVFWIGTFGYIAYVRQRQRALEKELEMIKTWLDEQQEKKDIQTIA